MEHIRYKEAFLLCDQNRSGVIQPSDVHFLIRALGFTPTEADLKRIDAEFLQGKQIDYLSFIDLMSKISCRKFSSEQIKDAFLTFDKNRYGLIHLEKFRTVMMSNGEPLTEDEMNEMLKDFPIDDDGFLDYEHFCSQFKEKDPSLNIGKTTADDLRRKENEQENNTKPL